MADGKILGVDRSTWAGGVSGFITVGIGLGLTAIGVAVPPAAIAPIALLIAGIFVHCVPDGAKIDETLKEIPSLVPTIDPTYPGTVNPPIDTNVKLKP
jgi:hypothetical protein